MYLKLKNLSFLAFLKKKEVICVYVCWNLLQTQDPNSFAVKLLPNETVLSRLTYVRSTSIGCLAGGCGSPEKCAKVHMWFK